MSPLQSGRLIRRYKRFLADIELDSGEQITAHCANPGAMTGLTTPGLRVWVSRSDNKKRKLPWSLEIIEAKDHSGAQHGVLVGVNTARPNHLVEEALVGHVKGGRGDISALGGYVHLRREVKYGENSRIDFLLSRPPVDVAASEANAGAAGGVTLQVVKNKTLPPDHTELCYVEVKNVHLMRQPGRAEFPDSVTRRGRKHLDELANICRSGQRAVMLYVIQRPDASGFALADDIDPDYAAAFARASAAGVEAYAWRCKVSPAGIGIVAELPVLAP